MAQSEPQKIEPATKEEAERLLTQVFGKEIFVETEYMKERNAGASKLDTIKNSAWRLYYNGIFIYFQSDLPAHQAREIARDIRNRFHFVTNYEQNKNKLPPLNELINDGMCIRIEPLRAFAAAGVTLVSPNYNPIEREMNLALAHEIDWRNYENYVISRANELIFGASKNISSRNHSSYFRFETRDRYWGETAHWLYTLVEAPVGLFRHEQVKKRLEGKANTSFWDVCIDAPDIFNKRAKELGIDHLFKYESFHEGTHASRDEERLIMTARSTEALTLKLAELAQPETLEKVKTFFREVMHELFAGHILDTHPPGFWDELYKAVPKPKGVWKKISKEDREKIFSLREKGCKQLERDPRYAPWIEMAKSLTEHHRTIGDMIEVLRNPPPDKETVCEQIKTHVLKTLPLLATEFEGLSPPARPQLSDRFDAPQVK